MQFDPMEGEGSCNYLFCANDPVGSTDPLGLDYIKVDGDDVYWFTEKGSGLDANKIFIGTLSGNMVIASRPWGVKALRNLRDLRANAKAVNTGGLRLRQQREYIRRVLALVQKPGAKEKTGVPKDRSKRRTSRSRHVSDEFVEYPCRKADDPLFQIFDTEFELAGLYFEDRRSRERLKHRAWSKVLDEAYGMPMPWTRFDLTEAVLRERIQHTIRAVHEPPILESGLAVGFQVQGSSVNPFTSRGGGVAGRNVMSFGRSSDNPALYGYDSQRGGGVGLDVGTSAQVVIASGHGPWSGTFRSVNVGVGFVAGSLLASPDGSWAGVTFGLAGGLPVAGAVEETYYTPLLPGD